MYRGISIVLAVVCLAFPAAASPATPSELRADLDRYFAALETIHPNPYHATPKAAMQAAADEIVAQAADLDDAELLMEVKRLVAMLGERDGHAYAIRPVRLYPLVPYLFPDGVFVVAGAGRSDLVGLRLVAVEGRPIDEVIRLVDPLVTRDNEWSLKAHIPPSLVTAELLRAVGVTAQSDRASFTFATRAGVERVVELQALPIARWTTLLQRAYPGYLDGLPQRPRPLFQRKRGTARWLTTTDRGRVVYFAYNQVVDSRGTFATADRLLRMARKPNVRRIVVDLRHNGGGNIGTYPYLLRTLQNRAINRPNRLVVLIGRTTFSAAVHFATDVKHFTRATLIGEPTGGSPNHYSDTNAVQLPAAGVTVGIPTIFYEKLPGEPGLTLEPDIRVDLTAADYFALRDPVLRRALR